MSILTQIFSSGATELVKGVGGVIDNLHTSKEEKLEAERKVKAHKREKQITKEHNIEAETFNPTGNTCMICGESRGSHSYTSGHQFKSSKK